MPLFGSHSPALSILTDAHSSGSASGTQSPVQWFSPAPSPVLPSPQPDRKGKARAIEDDRLLGVDEAGTRSFERSKRISVDLEGCSSMKRRGSGLGLGLLSMGEMEQRMPLAQRTRASPQLGPSVWKAPRLENTLSRLTRRRVSPASQLPLTAPSPSRSFSNESASSTSSTSSTGSLFALPASLRLQLASRPNRGKRKRNSVENSALAVCGCLCLLVILLLCGTRVSFAPEDRWRLLAGGPLIPSGARLPRVARSASLHSAGAVRSGRSTALLAPERDTLILYRILGNDLPPRHTHGQTLRNVRFMLENEHDFIDLTGPITRVEKYYVLNRIASEETVASLLSLFAEYGVPANRILSLPFEWDKYAETSLQWHGGIADYPGIWDLQRPDYNPISPFDVQNAAGEMTEAKRVQADVMGRLRAIDFTYHQKNQYAINNNGGRNFALAHGRELRHARWILPLDGNCFFTPSAMQSLVRSMSSDANQLDSPRYVVIPMNRLLDNEAVLPSNQPLADGVTGSEAPAAPEEPQIGFRFDSSDIYQTAMRYGRRSKLELLWRLGAVSFSRDLHRRTLPWEFSDRQILTRDSYASIKTTESPIGYVKAGWVFRLFSGDSRQEVHSAEATLLRNMNRVKGIVGFLERLDEVLVRGKRCPAGSPSCGFSKDLLWSVDAQQLAALAWQYRNGDHIERVDPLLWQADHAKVEVENAMSAGRIRAWTADEASMRAAQLAWAGFLSGNATYTHFAATLVQMRFLAEEAQTRQKAKLDEAEGHGYVFPVPAATYGQSSWLDANAPSSQWPADFDATQLLDTLRLLSPAHLPRNMRQTIGVLLPAKQVEKALSAHLARLLSTSKAIKTLKEGAAFDMQIAALAAAVDDVQLLGRVASRAALRLRHAEKAPRAHQWLVEGLKRVHYDFDEERNNVDGRRLFDAHEQSERQLASWGDAFAALEL